SCCWSGSTVSSISRPIASRAGTICTWRKRRRRLQQLSTPFSAVSLDPRRRLGKSGGAGQTRSPQHMDHDRDRCIPEPPGRGNLMHLSNRNRRWWRRPLVTGALLAVSATSAGAAEGLAIEPFPRAEVARERVQQASEHRVVIGNIRRINNQVRAERELQVVGELIRVSWRIPA